MSFSSWELRRGGVEGREEGARGIIDDGKTARATRSGIPMNCRCSTALKARRVIDPAMVVPIESAVEAMETMPNAPELLGAPAEPAESRLLLCGEVRTRRGIRQRWGVASPGTTFWLLSELLGLSGWLAWLGVGCRGLVNVGGGCRWIGGGCSWLVSLCRNSANIVPT